MAINNITCPVCGVEEPFKDDGPYVPLQDVAKFICDACGARVIFGKLAPNIVVEPYHDDRGLVWTRLRIQDWKTRADLFVADLDPNWAQLLVKNIMSLSVAT